MLRTVLVLASIATSVQAQHMCCPPGQYVRQLQSSNPTIFPDAHFCVDDRINTPVMLECQSEIKAEPMKEEALRFSNDNLSPLLAPRYYVNKVDQLVGTTMMLNQEVIYDNKFCLGNLLDKPGQWVLICYDIEEMVNKKVIDQRIQGCCLVISTIFLVITAGIYTALPDLQDLQGKSIINFCLSFGICLAVMAANKFILDLSHLCDTRGFLIYFFLVAGFFWITAISTQILQSMRCLVVSSYGWKIFAYYAILAWGSAAAITTVIAIINYVPMNPFKTVIGWHHCVYYNPKQQWYYMHSVIFSLIAVNLLMFLYIAVQLKRISFLSSHIKALRCKFVMISKISTLILSLWAIQILGSFLKPSIKSELLEIVFNLQGVFVFLELVVSRKRAIKCMYRRGWLNCISGPVENLLAMGEDEEEIQI